MRAWLSSIFSWRLASVPSSAVRISSKSFSPGLSPVGKKIGSCPPF